MLTVMDGVCLATASAFARPQATIELCNPGTVTTTTPISILAHQKLATAWTTTVTAQLMKREPRDASRIITMLTVTGMELLPRANVYVRPLVIIELCNRAIATTAIRMCIRAHLSAVTGWTMIAME
jgi:Na+-translocating ferredoxin:NAD+ oxidoreductase RNF subunit RnfB